MPYWVIKAKKEIVDAGSWQSGKVVGKVFPTHSPIALPSKAKWRCVKLEIYQGPDPPIDLRLLISVQVGKNSFNAWLGEMVGAKICVLAALEDHATHPGLHCHAPCERQLPGYVGSVRYPTMELAPAPGTSRRKDIVWSETRALSEAFKFFEVVTKPEGVLL